MASPAESRTSDSSSGSSGSKNSKNSSGSNSRNTGKDRASPGLSRRIQELDLNSQVGLRHYQRDLIINEQTANELIESFPDVLALAQRADRTLDLQLGSLDALSLWLFRANKSKEKAEIFAQIPPEKWDEVLSFFWTRWPTLPNKSSSHKVLKEIFSKALMFQRAVCTDWIQREIDLMERVHKLENCDLKVTCFLLESLVARIPGGAGKLFEIRPTWMTVMLHAMQEAGPSPAIGKCIVSVLKVRRKELVQQDAMSAAQKWVRIWREPTMNVLITADEDHVEHINKYFFPLLSKQFPSAFNNMWESMSRSLIKDRNFKGISSFLLCLSVAKTSGHVEKDPIEFFHDLNFPDDFFYHCLANISTNVRLLSFRFLTSDAQKAKPISTQIYDLVKQVLPLTFADDDMQYRNDVLHTIHLFIKRIRATSYNARKELGNAQSRVANHENVLQSILHNARKFTEWLVAYCRDCLTPGRTFYTTSMALDLLYILSTEEFFTDVDLGRPPSTTWGLHLKLFSKALVRLLIDRLADPYEGVARVALSLLSMMKDKKLIPLPELHSKGLELCNSVRTDRSQGGARALILCAKFQKESERKITWNNIAQSVNRDIEVGTLESLALKTPLQGRLVALRCMDYEYDRGAFLLVEDICKLLWERAGPILTRDSPEGNVHVFGQPALFTHLTHENFIDHLHKNGPLEHDDETQEILSSSWRSLKEATALLAHAIGCPSTTIDDFTNVGKMLMEWLCKIRHRGAFSAIMPSFEQIISLCCVDQRRRFHTLPKEWLKDCLSVITTQSFSITRRSGAIPMVVTAILTNVAKLDSVGKVTKELVDDVVEQLAVIAKNGYQYSSLESLNEEPSRWDLPEVHAANTLRAIFNESSLSNATYKYIETGFIIAIAGFRSQIYPIRNSSVMLFESLMNRALGQKYARQDIDPNAPNRSVSGRVFFSKFPNLRELLIKQLENDIEHLPNRDAHPIMQDTHEDRLCAGLYPVLTLISRLDVTLFEDTADTSDDMKEFVPLIDACLRSREIKIRSMAARCLPAVLKQKVVVERIKTTFKHLYMLLGRQNELNGQLMGIKHIGEFYAYRSLKDSVFGICAFLEWTNTDAIVRGMGDTMDIMMNKNKNPVNRRAFIDIAFTLFRNERRATELRKNLYELCFRDIVCDIIHPLGFYQYLEKAAYFVLDVLPEIEDHTEQNHTVRSLLHSEREEVLEATLSWLEQTCDRWEISVSCDEQSPEPEDASINPRTLFLNSHGTAIGFHYAAHDVKEILQKNGISDVERWEWPIRVPFGVNTVQFILDRVEYQTGWRRQSSTEPPSKRTESPVAESRSRLKTCSIPLNGLEALIIPPRSDWEGCCASAVRLITYFAERDVEVADKFSNLEDWAVRRQKSGMRVGNAWLSMSGLAVKKAILSSPPKEGSLSNYYQMMEEAIQPENVEYTRKAALRTLEIASIALKFVHDLPDAREYGEVIPAFLILLEFLSDNDSDIRQRASNIVSHITGSFLTLAPMAASEKLAECIVETFGFRLVKQYLINSLVKIDIDQTFKRCRLPSTVLFEKERQNVWKDEIFEFDLRLRMLTRCWEIQSEYFRENSDIFAEGGLRHWVNDGLRILDPQFKEEDGMFGWSGQIDLFEFTSKVFMTMQVLPNCRDDFSTRIWANELVGLIENMEYRHNPFWIEGKLIGEPDNAGTEAKSEDESEMAINDEPLELPT